MKLLILLTIIVNCVSGLSKQNIKQRTCNEIVITGINYEQEIIKDGLDAPYHLSLDYDNNYLFFTHTGKYSILKGLFVPAFIDLNTNVYGTIEGIRGAFAPIYDVDASVVYIGGADGIYEFDYETKSGIKMNITEKSIWQVFAKTSIYFTTFPEKKAYLYEDDEVKQVDGVGDVEVNQISVDAEDNIIYNNSTGLFCFKNNTRDTVYLGDYAVNGFTMNMNRELYFSTPTGIFAIRDNCKVEKLAVIDGLCGMAVSPDGSFLYASESSIIKLKSLGTECIPELDIMLSSF